MTRRAGLPTKVIEVDGHRVEYRRVGEGSRTALVLPGGHMSARCAVGEQALLDAGCTVLVVSRPGYGRTAVSAGPSPAEFAVRLTTLCAQLDLTDVTAVGISLGARTALALAAYAPGLVRDVVAMCPVSFRPWPDPAARRTARILFNPVSQHLTWAAVHALLRRDPDRVLPRLVADQTTLPPAEAVARLDDDRAAMVDFLLACRSGSGFSVDLRPPTDVTRQVAQPVLVLAGRWDGAVDRTHPQRLRDTLADARLVEVEVPCHQLWLGRGSDRTTAAIVDFLGRPTPDEDVGTRRSG